MRACLALLVIAWSLPSAAAAQRTSYESVLIGEQAAGMGGAFIALADDSSAAVHNPAGLAQIRQRGLSLSANTYTYASETLHDVLQGFGESSSMHATAVMAFPNATAYVLPLGGGDGWDHTGAFSLAVPYGLDFEGHERLSFRAFVFDLDLYQSIDEKVYLIGPSYGLRVGRFYVGASLFVQYVSSSEERQFAATVSDGMNTYRSESFDSTNSNYYGLTGVIGAMVRPTDEWSIGLRVRLPNLRVAGTATTYHTDVGSAVEVDPMTMMPAVTSLYQDAYREVESDTDYRYPLSFGLGVAYTRPGSLRIALDGKLHLPLDPYVTLRGDFIPPPTDQPSVIEGPATERGFDPELVDPGRRMVINGALGVDAHLGGDFSLLAGVFTDFSAVPDDGFDEAEQIDSYGGSLGLTRRTDTSSFTVGVTGRYGEGRATGLLLNEAGLNAAEIDVTMWSVTLFIAGSSTLGSDDEEEEVREEAPARSRSAPPAAAAPPAPAATSPSTTPAPGP